VFGSTVGGSGGYAEFALLPDGVSVTDAAALPIAAGTAHDGLADLRPAPGETLVILGVGGGVGAVAAQLAVMVVIDVAGRAVGRGR
jgi:NADPH:quinone reductase-like Zn-dependent oxidoreductase